MVPYPCTGVRRKVNGATEGISLQLYQICFFPDTGFISLRYIAEFNVQNGQQKYRCQNDYYFVFRYHFLEKDQRILFLRVYYRTAR